MRICSRCNSEQFVKIDNTSGQHFSRIKTGALTVAEVSRYVCCSCGFTEEWIENDDDLKRIKEKYLD